MTSRYDGASALLVVDVQNDFADPGGSLYVEGGDAVVAEINAELARARDAGATVVYTQDWHPPHTSHFDTDGGTWPVHCVQGSWGAEFHPALDVDADDPVIRKGVGGEDGYSGFSVRDPRSGVEASTELGALLRARGIARLVVVGLAGDVCVAATARDAQRLGYATTVPWDLTRCVRPQNAGETVKSLASAGITVDKPPIAT